MRTFYGFRTKCKLIIENQIIDRKSLVIRHHIRNDFRNI